MALDTALNDILDSRSKLKILRLFSLRTEDFMASGREIARLTSLSPPATHAALKSLLDGKIMKREIVGKHHIYKLDSGNRIVRTMIRPLFFQEKAVKDDVKRFLLGHADSMEARDGLVSMILYGSLASGLTHEASDCDIAVVARDSSARDRLEMIFRETISDAFHSEFGIHLDPYFKTVDEFAGMMRDGLPPVSTLISGYEVIYGKDPLEYV